MKLADGDILKLLPPHIADDPQFHAAGEAANPLLNAIARSIPNLLIYARLGNADAATFLPPLRRLTEVRPGLAPLDMETLESLAWQFHVDFREVAKSREELAEMVLNSIPWHRIKGTPASMQAALKLFGYENIRIEEHDFTSHWATYQLGLPAILELEDIARIVAICREMQPARCRLWRVYTGGGADNPDADPGDGFDMRPGVWSGPLPRCAWSNAWWSFYSGVEFPDIPGLDGGLIVSFGSKKSYASEPWAAGEFLAALWAEQARAFRIFLLPRYIWSHSNWSDWPPRRHGFVVGELFATHACELLWDSAQWPQEPWQAGQWAKNLRWDRRLPDWRMFCRQIYKSQGVYSDFCLDNPGHSWPTDRWLETPWGAIRNFKEDTAYLGQNFPGSAWSALNNNWSWPVLAHVPPAPVWSGKDVVWSGEKQRVQYEIIQEQFINFHRATAKALDALAASFGFAESCFAFLFPRRDGAEWSRAVYSQKPTGRPQFFHLELLAALDGEAIYESQNWAASGWPAKPWGKLLSYGRKEPAWAMSARATSRSQGVYSADETWSGLNSRWGRPVITTAPKAPAWSASRYSGDSREPAATPLHELAASSLALTAPALRPVCGPIHMAMQAEAESAIANPQGPVWSESGWSDAPRPLQGQTQTQKLALGLGSLAHEKQPWSAAPWHAKAWRRVAGFERPAKTTAFALRGTWLWPEAEWQPHPWANIYGNS